MITTLLFMTSGYQALVKWLKLRRHVRRNYYRTLWKPSRTGPGLHCVNCGQGYNRHGGPTDVARFLKVPKGQRHLICQRPPP